MTRVQLAPLVSHLRRLASAPWVQERTDAELLAQFVTQRDETAFTALVARHGQVVQGVCRNILRNEQEVEDAVQATFLILARKAGTIQKAGSIASWLHGVAYRTAMNARKIDARRRRREKQSPARSPEQPVSEAAFREIQAILHEEVQRLPARCRAPFILCCLEGKSRTEAARQLGWKDRSVTARLTEAKGILRTRLTRRGVALSAALCASAVSPAGVVSAAAIRDVLLCVAGQAPPNSTSAIHLADRIVCDRYPRWILHGSKG